MLMVDIMGVLNFQTFLCKSVYNKISRVRFIERKFIHYIDMFSFENYGYSTDTYQIDILSTVPENGCD